MFIYYKVASKPIKFWVPDIRFICICLYVLNCLCVCVCVHVCLCLLWIVNKLIVTYTLVYIHTHVYTCFLCVTLSVC